MWLAESILSSVNPLEALVRPNSQLTLPFGNVTKTMPLGFSYQLL